MDTRAGELAERVRAALLHASIDAYEDAGIRGLCAEGRWEYAVEVMASLDLGPVCAPQGERPSSIHGSSRAASATDAIPPATMQPEHAADPSIGGQGPERASAPPGRSPGGGPGFDRDGEGT
jgi:hypothetical protein